MHTSLLLLLEFEQCNTHRTIEISQNLVGQEAIAQPHLTDAPYRRQQWPCKSISKATTKKTIALEQLHFQSVQYVHAHNSDHAPNETNENDDPLPG